MLHGSAIGPFQIGVTMGQSGPGTSDIATRALPGRPRASFWSSHAARERHLFVPIGVALGQNAPGTSEIATRALQDRPGTDLAKSAPGRIRDPFGYVIYYVFFRHRAPMLHGSAVREKNHGFYQSKLVPEQPREHSRK